MHFLTVSYMTVLGARYYTRYVDLKKKKKEQCKSCELSLFGDFLRNLAQKTDSQIV